jgi:hypothetical protein
MFYDIIQMFHYICWNFEPNQAIRDFFLFSLLTFADINSILIGRIFSRYRFMTLEDKD